MNKEATILPGNLGPDLIGNDWCCAGASSDNYPVGSGTIVGAEITYMTFDAQGNPIDSRMDTPLRGCQFNKGGKCQRYGSPVDCPVSSVLPQKDFAARLAFLHTLPHI